jgi:NTP pyrophosphatase (non-canonical NTP hydrolase)
MPLTFNELREANRLRTERCFHPIEEWSPTDWATAVAGEVGEACNKVKKLRRGEDISIYAIGAELADTVIYIDLLCQRLGLDLGDCITRKFNEKSRQVGSEVTL